MEQYLSPLVPQRADPFILKHNGIYYFTATHPSYDKIELRSAQSINGLASAQPRVVWNRRPHGEMSSHVWAPEIHFLMGKWVIYFAASDEADVWKIRPYVLVCRGDDPMRDEWTEGGMMRAAQGDPFSFTDFSLDATVFEHRGRWYTIWAQKVGNVSGISNLYLAALKTPSELESVQVLLSTPDYDWERDGGFWVNEGPAVLKHGEKIYCTFSASATGACYCMGMLEADGNADLLDPASWKKRRYPVLKTNPSLKIYGPGHNSFTEGENGETLCVLHFRNYETIKGDPLNDRNRHAHVLKVGFDRTGAPVFEPNASALYNAPFENERQTGIND
ncbi:MAG: family 43 glycosylhydrolase [Candidatus Gallimonas sp.]